MENKMRRHVNLRYDAIHHSQQSEKLSKYMFYNTWVAVWMFDNEAATSTEL
jgi:hypothetical protein